MKISCSLRKQTFQINKLLLHNSGNNGDMRIVFSNQFNIFIHQHHRHHYRHHHWNIQIFFLNTLLPKKMFFVFQNFIFSNYNVNISNIYTCFVVFFSFENIMSVIITTIMNPQKYIWNFLPKILWKIARKFHEMFN